MYPLIRADEIIAACLFPLFSAFSFSSAMESRPCPICLAVSQLCSSSWQIQLLWLYGRQRGVVASQGRL
jgi:hypothetical protein